MPPEVLLKATVLMALYSIRSERAFCERLNYDLLFKWFLDMRIDQAAFDATTCGEAELMADLGQRDHDDVLIERDDQHGERQERERRPVATTSVRPRRPA
jgi:Transposase domain (DUF772)